MSGQRFCVDCKHYLSETFLFKGHFCGRNMLLFYESVSGGVRQKGVVRAEVERKAWFFGCGKKAKYFEQKGAPF
jgi:hypothetical protein